MTILICINLIASITIMPFTLLKSYRSLFIFYLWGQYVKVAHLFVCFALNFNILHSNF